MPGIRPLHVPSPTLPIQGTHSLLPPPRPHLPQPQPNPVSSQPKPRPLATCGPGERTGAGVVSMRGMRHPENIGGVASNLKLPLLALPPRPPPPFPLDPPGTPVPSGPLPPPCWRAPSPVQRSWSPKAQTRQRRRPAPPVAPQPCPQWSPRLRPPAGTGKGEVGHTTTRPAGVMRTHP
jgi:hypothetical protein